MSKKDMDNTEPLVIDGVLNQEMLDFLKNALLAGVSMLFCSLDLEDINSLLSRCSAAKKLDKKAANLREAVSLFGKPVPQTRWA